MLDIYVSHSTTGFDYKNGLYVPLRRSSINENHQLFLPHENSDAQFDSKDVIKSMADLVIAESSFSKIGVGIELGWADAFGVPIICIYRKNSEPSRSLTVITDRFIEYGSREDMVSKLETAIKDVKMKVRGI